MADKRRALFGFASGAGIGALGGLIGLGGAEFRLPLLKGLFGLPTLEAIIFNKAMSLIVVFVALILRGLHLGWDEILVNADVVFNLLLGSLAGAWVMAGFTMRMNTHLLNRLVMFLLIGLAIVMLAEASWGGEGTGGIEPGWLRFLLGVLAGLVIGAVAALLGVAGGELLIPTIVLLYGIDIKIAGSLSLAVSLPTMLAGLFRYRSCGAFGVFRHERPLLTGMGPGSVCGVAIGVLMLGMVSSRLLAILLAIILLVSAIKVFHHD